MRISTRTIVTMALLLPLLTGCFGETEGPALPEGPQTLTGLLLPLPISLAYRGSHRFQREPGVDFAYAESNAVNLRRQEGKTVVLRGRLEPNFQVTDPPVFVVESLVAILEEPLKTFSAPSLGIAFEAPESWRVEIGSGSVRIIVPNLVEPLIEITREALLSEPTGEPVVLDRQRALLVRFESDGSERITLPRGSSAMVFYFRPQDPTRLEQLSKQWAAFLESVSLSGKSSAPSSVKTESGMGVGTGTGAGLPPATESLPCGGPAGILCPAGFYCAVENLAENIGHCRPLGQ